MTREKMLELLEELPFALINPPSSWEDVGFTEREIWVNSNGYGYIMCDEVLLGWEGKGVPKRTWNRIKRKIDECEVSFADIKGTALEDFAFSMLCIIPGFDDDPSDDDIQYLLEDLSRSMKDGPGRYFYALKTDFGVECFETKEAFKKAYEKTDASVYWDEMDDQLLAEWINRLSREGAFL